MRACHPDQGSVGGRNRPPARHGGRGAREADAGGGTRSVRGRRRSRKAPSMLTPRRAAAKSGRASSGAAVRACHPDRRSVGGRNMPHAARPMLPESSLGRGEKHATRRGESMPPGQGSVGGRNMPPARDRTGETPVPPGRARRGRGSPASATRRTGRPTRTGPAGRGRAGASRQPDERHGPHASVRRRAVRHDGRHREFGRLHPQSHWRDASAPRAGKAGSRLIRQCHTSANLPL